MSHKIDNTQKLTEYSAAIENYFRYKTVQQIFRTVRIYSDRRLHPLFPNYKSGL